MAIGDTLGQMKYPVSSEGAVFSRIGGPSNAAHITEEGNGSREKEKERERERERGRERERESESGMEVEARRARSVLGAHPKSESQYQNIRKNATQKESS
jgi:hypothetical protein